MRRIRGLLSVVLNHYLNKPKPTHFVNPFAAEFGLALRPCATPSLLLPSLNKCYVQVLPFSSSDSLNSKVETSEAPATKISRNAGVYDDDDDDDNNSEVDSECEDGDTNFKRIDSEKDDSLDRDIEALLCILRDGTSCSEMRRKLDQCGVVASSELVAQVLGRVRNDWEAAFTFFLWAGKQPGYAHSVREYHSMIAILGKMRKFDTAWALIDEMRTQTGGPSLVTPQTLLIMIRRYCAVHDVGRAMNTFYAYKRFNFCVGMDEFHGLLSALCRYKNVQDAEHLLFCNKNVFPLNTKSFNIILNGWCNVIGSPREAQRIWWEMSKRGVHHDVVSYASIISCHSKAGNLYKVLKIFDRMKALEIAPDRKVYNAVIHALAKGRFVKEAIDLLRTMEEKGVAPNAVTYNSLIKPLCKARKIDEAKHVFDEMLQHGLPPSVQTYHAFFRVLRTVEEVFMLLEKMKNTGCGPNSDTYIMLIRKFCRWRQVDDVCKLWNEMSESGVGPDRSSYIVLIHGLFLNGKLEEAHKYYMEMKEKNYLPEPRTEEMLQAWLSGKLQKAADIEHKQLDGTEPYRKSRSTSEKFNDRTHFLRDPETRRVVRERGFSFWEK